jgi:hypothetical protein
VSTVLQYKTFCESDSAKANSQQDWSWLDLEQHLQVFDSNSTAQSSRVHFTQQCSQKGSGHTESLELECERTGTLRVMLHSLTHIEVFVETKVALMETLVTV